MFLDDPGPDETTSGNPGKKFLKKILKIKN